MRIILLLLLLYGTCYAGDVKLADVKITDITVRSTYTDYSQDANCVGCWRFDDDTADTAVDISGNNNHGSTSSSPIYTTGKEGKCWDFDGADDFLLIKDNTNLDDLGSLTFCVWIYPDSNGELNLGRIIDKAGLSTTANTALYMGYTGELWFYVRGSTSLYRRANDNSVTLSAWNFVVVTWDGTFTDYTTIHIYVNGAEVSYQAGQNGVSRTSNAANNLTIGSNEGASRSFNGKIDEVIIFDRVLTSSEIQDIYKHGIK